MIARYQKLVRTSSKITEYKAEKKKEENTFRSSDSFLYGGSNKNSIYRAESVRRNKRI
ncbi:hypothetical protein P4V41_10900 [Fictibacillus nanhaiensis]|uniref:hypothetical protein n=1 Tax=Fictibacillus nanhaiensis TaxID=742169 RepID=UPI002E2462EC|nr:hypothetical protein [Fictibacillus nanhaiensis]